LLSRKSGNVWPKTKIKVGPRVPYESRNLKSVLNNPAIAWEKVKNEVNAGRIAGPFSYRPISNLRVSSIGLVPKKTGGTSVKEFINFEQLLVLSAPANKKSSR
jgi:hypothetical protein